MSGSKSFTFNVSSKVAVATALGAGVVVGAGLAYVINRVNEHTHLTQQISSLHETILQVRRDLASLETEVSATRVSPFRKKTVSFSSTTSGSYKTAREYDSDNRATDTDYFSPDEDDDEFFDLSPEDGSVLISYGDSSYAPPADIERISPVSLEDDEDFQLFLHKIDQLLEGGSEDQSEAYSMLKNKEHENSRNAEFLWRLAKATRNMAVIQEKLGVTEEKEQLINEAYEYAACALQLCQDSADVHKWYAILAGARGEYMGMKDRIESGNVFKEHIDKALQINPKDSTLHHLLGRFCFEVSQLTWLERKVAKTIFGNVPSSTFSEALHHFMAAEELRPTGWKENRLFIAKCNIQLGNFSVASTWLKQAADSPFITPDDEIVQKEVLELQGKCSSYPEF
ncbi:regulator of microtubule dynamics protein 1-like [Penaeus chinensis]|uniref:regulator of microtubule dynamics protein 1-like n=1 Tax=Penaeus chinensis TaxID=139456 RepID=UPI001FB614B6|nr:regulator of microtubule dynamics protein 1-like [Penaeus chinensis]XP_047477854.1 regulator of microtubule dynamics protein 1-like [Penaeus chinensis]XP_047477855.1 regulator of microtubule dynamics protein 1-like [Penaeus chinensis]XP_047477856.1 regulator of microtubule dynamics protein 1-like [Penaeus chinensis]